MKCLNCGNEWSQKLKKNSKGQYELDKVRCPKCGSKDISITMVGR